MKLTGCNFVGSGERSGGSRRFNGVDPATGESLLPSFSEASREEVDAAGNMAARAFLALQEIPSSRRSMLLREVATQIMALGDLLITRAASETALPVARLEGERVRTVNQIKLFAELIEEGSWVDARIDTGQPERKPVPRPALRRMLFPIGPVAVFGASNFPLAFSVAGGDTVSALAAGNPVIVKAHPSHPGTSELVARAILEALEQLEFPDGTFSLLHGAGTEVGTQLVEHPSLRAVAFTGSLRGGRALFDLAARRPDPIPVYAEMGSVNPVVLLPSALNSEPEGIAEGLHNSFTLGVGQFCTNPGLILAVNCEGLEPFLSALARLVTGGSPGTMLNRAILRAFEAGVERFRNTAGVTLVAETRSAAGRETSLVRPAVFRTTAIEFTKHSHLEEEVFGPSTLVVVCDSVEELTQLASGLPGQLTVSIHATAAELSASRGLLLVLKGLAGRLVFNGFPTGVEVVPAMQHGGPYPATTDSRSTSVGTASIQRFARPICFQDFPAEGLPPELQDENPLRIWRQVNGQITREPIL